MSTIATLAINLLGNVSGLKSALGDAQQSIKATASSMQNMGTKMTAGVTAPILGFAGAAIKAAADQEQLQVAFTTMLGSAEKAKTMMADLSQFAAATPFESPEIQNASKMLLAFGVSAEDIVPTMTNLGDIAAGLNVPLGDMAYLFGTTRASGRLMTADLNQFTTRGTPMIAALAKTMNIAESDVKKFVESGKVGFPEVQAALQSLTTNGGQFEGLMAAQSQTLSGLFSTLKDTIGLTMAEIGKTIIETFDLKGKLSSALEWLGQMKDALLGWAKANPELFRLGIIIATVAAAIGPLLFGLGMVVGVIGNLLPVVAVLGGALGALISPLGLVAAAIGALVYFDVGGIRAALGGIFDNIVAAAPKAGTALRELVAQLTGFGIDSYDTTEGIYEFTEALTGSKEIAALVSNTIGDLGYALFNYTEAVRDAGFGSIEAKEAISLLPQSLQGIASIADTAIAGLSNLRTAIVDYISNLDWSSVGASFSSLGTAISNAFSNFSWESALATLGTIRTAATDYISGLDWSSLGAAFTSLGTVIHDAFAAIDWGAVLTTLGNIRTAVVDYITGLDWSVVTGAFDTLRTAITGAFTSFDWGSVLTTLGNIRTAVVDYITGLDWSMVTGAFGTLQAAISEALGSLDLSGAMSGLQTAFSNAISGVGLGDAFTGLQTGMESVRTAIGSAVDGIMAAWGGLMDFFGPSIARLQESFGTMFSGFGELGPTFARLQEAISNAVTAIAPLVQVMAMVIGGQLGVLAVLAINTLAAVFEALPAIIEAVVGQVTAIINLIATTVGGMVTIVVSLLQGDFAGAWEGLKTVVIGVLDFIQATLGSWATLLGAAFGAVRDIIVNTFSDLASALGLDGALASVTAFKDNLVAVFSGEIFGAGMPAWLSTLVGWAWPTLPAAPGWLTTLLSWAWPGFIGEPAWLSGLMSWLWPAFPSAPGWLTSLFSFRWPSLPSAPAWLSNLNPFGGSEPGANALGTQYWRGGRTWVGESGPELVQLPRGSRVFPNGESMAMAGAGGPTVVIQNAYIREERDIQELAYRINDIGRRRR
jgi:tape measure domain-containing protein